MFLSLCWAACVRACVVHVSLSASLGYVQVGEIVDRAQKEEKMEQALAKLKDTWARVEFQFIQFKDTPVSCCSGSCSRSESLNWAGGGADAAATVGF